MAQALELMRECDAWLDQHPEGFDAMPADPSLEHQLCDALETLMGLCAVFTGRPALTALAAARSVQQMTERAA